MKVLVICKTKEQAKNLFQRYVELQHKSKNKVRVNDDALSVSTPFESFSFLPERGSSDAISRYGRYVECAVTPYRAFDKWLDDKEKEQKKDGN